MSTKLQLTSTFIHRTSTHEFTIRWTKSGDDSKPPVVFIHGTPWSNAVWHDLAETLQKTHCIYLYDHPGFAESPRLKRNDGADPELDPSLELRAEASAALFRHWNFQTPPHVVAHDNGGLVSLRLYLQHDIRMESLCLIDVVAIGPFGKPFFKLVAENEQVFRQIPPNFAEGFARAYVKSAAHKPLSPEVSDLLVNQWLEGGLQGPNRFLEEMIQAHNRTIGSVQESYSRVGQEIPVKIIWGKEDTWLPVETAQRLKDALNARDYVLIDEAGHLILYDQPSQLAVQVASWLSSH